jgi:hypothetical protein
MRTLSSAALASGNAAQTDEVWLALVEITHDDLVTPIRVVNNTEDITSNGNTFVGYPFDIVLTDDVDDSPPTASIEIDNVDRDILDTIRTITTAPDVKIQIILASQPDTIELEIDGMQLVNVEADATTIQGNLQFTNILDQKFPQFSFVPSLFPALFKS